MKRKSSFGGARLAFSTTWGNAFLGVGSARFRFLTLDGALDSALNAGGDYSVDVTLVGKWRGRLRAASAAAFASPWSASMGALREARGSVSSDSSSEDGAVLGTIPYVAYL